MERSKRLQGGSPITPVLMPEAHDVGRTDGVRRSEGRDVTHQGPNNDDNSETWSDVVEKGRLCEARSSKKSWSKTSFRHPGE